MRFDGSRQMYSHVTTTTTEVQNPLSTPGKSPSISHPRSTPDLLSVTAESFCLFWKFAHTGTHAECPGSLAQHRLWRLTQGAVCVHSSFLLRAGSVRGLGRLCLDIWAVPVWRSSLHFCPGRGSPLAQPSEIRKSLCRKGSPRLGKGRSRLELVRPRGPAAATGPHEGKSQAGWSHPTASCALCWGSESHRGVGGGPPPRDRTYHALIGQCGPCAHP